MSVRVTCPLCRIVCGVPKEHLGKVIRCPGCKQTFSVRAPDSTGPSPGPAPARVEPPAADELSDLLSDVVLPPAPPQARTFRLETGSATSPGRVRLRNEDSFLVEHLTWVSQGVRHDAALTVVADGMGGHDAGDRASGVAIEVVAAALAPYMAGLVSGQEKSNAPEPMLDALDRALWEANRAIARAAAEEPGCAGMGSTGVAAVVIDGLAAICHVGDCRAYLHRAGALQQLTRDQTLVMRMIELGTLSEREATTHPAASQVTQALGKQDYLEPSRQTLELQSGDRLVLACDGLHAHLDARTLTGVIGQADNAANLAATLVERANQAGGSDNCTVVVVWVR